MAAIEDRCVGAILGSVISDAAGAPIQWVYDADKLNKEILSGGQNPEFLTKNYNPFFTVPTGKSTYYGEQVYVLLETLVEAKGWNKELYRKKLFEWFGPGTKYDHAAAGVDLSQKPINAPWQSSIMKAFISSYQGNGEIYNGKAMIETASQVAPLVALYAGKPELKANLEEFSRTLQDNDGAVQVTLAAGALVEEVILKGHLEDPAEVFKREGQTEALGWINEVREMNKKKASCVDAVGQFGRHCGAEACFKSGMYAVATGGKQFLPVSRESLRSGGDICGRGSWLGAFMGGWTGYENLPKDWIQKTELAQKTVKLAQQLVELR